MEQSRFTARLEQEVKARRERKPRYSLRALAAFLNADHSTLSQILRGSRRAPVRQIRAWAKKLDIEPEGVSIYIAAAHVPERSALRRQQHLRHWTSEAMS